MNSELFIVALLIALQIVTAAIALYFERRADKLKKENERLRELLQELNE